jgi:hypothetical protein
MMINTLQKRKKIKIEERECISLLDPISVSSVLDMSSSSRHLRGCQGMVSESRKEGIHTETAVHITSTPCFCPYFGVFGTVLIWVVFVAYGIKEVYLVFAGEEAHADTMYGCISPSL